MSERTCVQIDELRMREYCTQELLSRPTSKEAAGKLFLTPYLLRLALCVERLAPKWKVREGLTARTLVILLRQLGEVTLRQRERASCLCEHALQ